MTLMIRGGDCYVCMFAHLQLVLSAEKFFILGFCSELYLRHPTNLSIPDLGPAPTASSTHPPSSSIQPGSQPAVSTPLLLASSKVFTLAHGAGSLLEVRLSRALWVLSSISRPHPPSRPGTSPQSQQP